MNSPWVVHCVAETGAVTLEQLVQFLVADYQVHLSNHFHANRKALNRQQSLLENARSSMIKAKHAALAALPTSERLARTLESTDDENVAPPPPALPAQLGYPRASTSF